MTRQNTSSAVMQQRHESKNSLDDFPTPPWATRALCDWLEAREPMRLSSQTVLEPACNRGFMARPLEEYFSDVFAYDIHHYGDDHYANARPCRDFMTVEDELSFDWVITNPPFTLAAEFIQKGLKIANEGVAVIVRSAFLEGGERYNTLFSITPPTHVLQFVERVPMVKGACVDYVWVLETEGARKGTYIRKRVTTATSYVWLVWDKLAPQTEAPLFHWLAPCRKRLEREGDYQPTYSPVAPAQIPSVK